MLGAVLDAATTLKTSRTMSGLSRRQVAVLAGVAPSTVSRIEQRQMDPTVGTLDRLLAACGYRLTDGVEPRVDPDAIRAARRTLEPGLGIPATDGSESYLRRWEDAGLLTARSPEERANELCVRTAQQANLSRRPGARRFAWADWRETARRLGTAGQGWALTGGFAADCYTPIAYVDWPVFYVDDPETAAAVAGLDPVGLGPATTFIPFDEVTAAGIQTVEGGLRLAGFWQIVIDCYAGKGRMPSQAESMVDGLTTRRPSA